MKILDFAKWIHLNFQPIGDGWEYTHYGYDEGDPISEEEYTSEELVALFKKLTKKSRKK